MKSYDGPPLAGIRVLDFTHVLAGPFCTRLLADFGADVVRVESSKRPDRLGAGTWKPGYEERQDRPAAYLNNNRSKRSVTIDLKNKAGYRLAVRLARSADILIENFSAGVMAKLKLDAESLRPLNRRLIYVSMSGYGHQGPRRDWTSMNMNLQGYSGLMMVTGSEGDPPTAISNSWNDYIGGLHACFGIFQALAERAATGEGARLDLSQFECSVATLAPLLLGSAVNRTVPPRLGNRSPENVPQGCYRCAGADAWCAISVQNDEQWQALLGVLGRSSWGEEPDLASPAGRWRRHNEIDRRIEEWTSRLPDTEVERRLKDAGVPAERMRRIQSLIDAPDGAEIFFSMAEPRVGSMLTTGIPFTLSSGSYAPARPAPSLGQHSHEILRDWLDIPDGEIAELEEQKALL
jgi:crotonobetainyl-CoA:carnitine CoA-transferase CaiB-like acyl-CoA transferase